MQKQDAVRRKIKKFYERELKAVWFKVTGEFYNDIESMSHILDHKIKRLDKHPTWCRSVVLKIVESGDDFVRNMKTVIITYTYQKYGNL